MNIYAKMMLDDLKRSQKERGVRCRKCDIIIGDATGYARDCSACDERSREYFARADAQIDAEIERRIDRLGD
jgi:hypothetical protein